MPSDVSNLRYKHGIQLENHMGDQHMPIAHTCFFSIDLPCYSTDEICEKRLLTAILFCGEIDGDYGADNIADEDDDTRNGF